MAESNVPARLVPTMTVADWSVPMPGAKPHITIVFDAHIEVAQTVDPMVIEGVGLKA